MKKNIRRILFTSCLIAILVAIAIVCLIIGRGHTIYFDNIDLASTDYKAYESIIVNHDGEKIGSLDKDGRVSMTITGQKLELDLTIQKDSTSKKETITLNIDLPYNLDGIIINLPACIEGASQDIYLSEFISVTEEETDEEVPVTDEFGMTTDE